MQRPTRVAIYARVSTTEQDPEAQLFALRTYAAQRGFEVYWEYRYWWRIHFRWVDQADN